MAKEQKGYSLYLLAIVAIIAIVGIVLMVSGKGLSLTVSSTDSTENLAGQAFSKNVPEIVPKPICIDMDYNGINTTGQFYTKSYVKFNNKIIKDSCLSKTTVIEGMCSSPSNQFFTVSFDCSNYDYFLTEKYACEDGVCVKARFSNKITQ